MQTELLMLSGGRFLAAPQEWFCLQVDDEWAHPADGLRLQTIDP